MLVHLTIKNYALIKHLEVKPSARLNVITGETGAGKSILLGAISLLLGNRADTKVLWDDSAKCVTEGVFDLSAYSLNELFEAENLDYEKNTVLRREISPNGKSRAFINDTPVTLEVMKKIGSRLMDVHSQHETLELGSRQFQLHLVDTFAGNQKQREEYGIAWRAYTDARKEYETLLEDSALLKEEADFVKFQLQELVKADFREGEQEEWESQLKIMEHAEDIKTRFNRALVRMGNPEFSVLSSLAEVRSQLHPITAYAPAYQQLFQRLESARIELNDIVSEIENEESKIEFDPKRTEEVKERLSLIYQLLQKHRFQNLRELLIAKEVLERKADKTNNVDALLAEAKRVLDKTTKDLDTIAKGLSTSRQKIFVPLSNQIVALLKQLGIPEAKLVIDNESVVPGPTGGDSIEVLFSANKGISPRPLVQVASGGEFSRLMFCVKYVMAEKTSLPTLILDEIDTGVSGQIAIQLGTLMKAMAQRHQIVAISHLPQIAAKGDTHYFVYKDNSASKTITHIRKLEDAERIAEIAKMIGGARPSPLALENAKELMQG
jgi:DNA repair protein RecN (Recombination protein N)